MMAESARTPDSPSSLGSRQAIRFDLFGVSGTLGPGRSALYRKIRRQQMTPANALSDPIYFRRFWTKVAMSDGDGCWIWIASLRNGYGHLRVEGRRNDYAH